MTNVHYADDLVLFTYTHCQVESQLHCVEQAAVGIGFSVNAKKKKNRVHFKWQASKISDKFTYLGRKISSSENDVSLRIGKAIDTSLMVWKSGLSDKIKGNFY